VCAAGGQVLLSYLGRTLRTGITWTPARFVDSAAGAGLNILALAIVTWIIATAVAFLPQSSVTSQIRSSGVLVGLDSLVPDAVRNGFGQVRDAVGATAVPRIFSGLGEISGPDVQPADPRAAGNPAIEAARGSILRVTGSAAACGSSFSGSGFVIADGYVLTNAHVVAGVLKPTVQIRSGEPLVESTVVAFDPKLDAAVLFAPGLDAPSLPFAGGAPVSGDEAVVGGFPGGGRWSRSRGVFVQG
jgi:S1-C subfamily serine protease